MENLREGRNFSGPARHSAGEDKNFLNFLVTFCFKTKSDKRRKRTKYGGVFEI
jgi:hypothetical protein